MSRRTLSKLIVAAVVAAGLVTVYFSPLREYITRENIRTFVEHLRGLWYGPIVFVLVFAIGCVFAVPASIFVLAAGLIWGWLFGTAYSILGAMLGAMASFFLGRFVGEGILQRFGRLGRIVMKQVDHAGFFSLLVARQIPGIPFAVLNYGAGAAGVRFRDFFFSTLVGITPSLFVFTYSADAVFNGSLSEGDAVLRLLIVCALMLAIVLLPQLVKRFVRRATPTETAVE